MLVFPKNAAKNASTIEKGLDPPQKMYGRLQEINIEILGVKGLMLILESWKSPGNLFLKKATNPDYPFAFLMSKTLVCHSRPFSQHQESQPRGQVRFWFRLALQTK